MPVPTTLMKAAINAVDSRPHRTPDHDVKPDLADDVAYGLKPESNPLGPVLGPSAVRCIAMAVRLGMAIPDLVRAPLAISR